MDENNQKNPLMDDVQSSGVVTNEDVAAALIEAEQTVSMHTTALEPIPTEDLETAETSAEQVMASAVAVKRGEHVQQFSLDLNLDDDIPDAEGMGVDSEQEEVSPVASDDEYTEPVKIVEDEEEEVEEAEAETQDDEIETTSSGGVAGCITKLIFALVVLAISCVLATGICIFIFGATGWIGSSDDAEVHIPEGANTLQVAELLKEQDLINDVWCFRIYSRLVGADGKWQVGAFTLQGDMGFATIIETLQVAPPRETVTVMLREGLTIDEMAVILEEKGVCSKQEFLNAVLYGEYDYDFIKQIPTEDAGADYAYRVYRLEGYLFPDTYEFYVGSKGTTVVDKMLSNFQSKLTTALLEKIEAQGWTLDEAIIFASMVQGEGDTRENMDKVARVLHNRLAPKSGFSKLELCCTRDYANEMAENNHFNSDALHQAYNTYNREGFPVGPIGNPGMDALLAALNPSEDSVIMKCYYFATDYKTGITYFSKTYREHQAIIKKYGIEDLG